MLSLSLSLPLYRYTRSELRLRRCSELTAGDAIAAIDALRQLQHDVLSTSGDNY